MASDQSKIAALKAIRDKARAQQLRDGRPLSDEYRDICSDGNYDDELANGPFPDDDEEFVFHEVARPVADDEGVSGSDYDEEAEDYDSADDDIAEDDADEEDEPYKPDDDDGGALPNWTVAMPEEEPLLNIEFNGKNLENGEFDHEDLENANFSAANLSGVNFSGSNLRGVDFSGADLSNTNLSGADLTGATFDGAKLIGTNFTGAVLKNVTFTDVDFENAILLDIKVDDVTLEDLQELIEYLAKYYPEKLNLTRINLTMLDLTRIDLSKVNLRGVDFTGVDFTGINIAELDLSECIITPQQIAQAIGHVPNAMELKKLLAPKKKSGQSFKGIDMAPLFLDDGRDFDLFEALGIRDMDVGKLVNIGSKIAKHFNKEKPPVEDEKALEYIRQEREQQNRANKDELRQVIEERKRQVLAAKRRREIDPEMMLNKDRGGYQR